MHSNALASQLETLAATFASEVVKAIRSAQLEDILSLADGQPGSPEVKPARKTRDPELWNGLPTQIVRSSPTLAAAKVSLVVRYIKGHPGCSGQEARKVLGFPREAWGYYVTKALKAGLLRKQGEKSLTKYWAVG